MSRPVKARSPLTDFPRYPSARQRRRAQAQDELPQPRRKDAAAKLELEEIRRRAAERFNQGKLG